jgi:hypothetical protein
MGASEWRYLVPFQQDPTQALADLRTEVFDSGDYYWYAEDPNQPQPTAAERPDRLEDLWEDEAVQEEGTHSILDMFRIAEPDREAAHHDIVVTTPEEAEFATGSSDPTEADVDDLIEALTEDRWVGRCAVLHDDQGHPTKLLFWGISGD